MSTKVKCECGLEVNELILEKHITTKTHNLLIASKYKKINNYNDYKDIVNCCSVCLRTDIANGFFIKDIKSCICCDEISRGGEKRCRDCKEFVNVTRLERPYLIRCKDCANERLSQLKKCEICDKEFRLHHLSQHKQRVHAASFVKITSH